MVKLHVKRGDQSQFLFETSVKEPVHTLVKKLVKIYNGRLKIDRLFYELETLANHGITLPPNMQGLSDDQVKELKLEDKWAKSCYPQGGSIECKDPVGRRSGNAPNAKMKDVIDKTRNDARAQVSKDLVQANKCLTYDDVQDALDKMKGAVMIVYPMGLPPHDPVKLELDNEEDLTGTQASKEVLDDTQTSIWWAGKEFMSEKKLEDYVGKNEKTKIIVKLQKKGQSAPAREPVISQEEQKAMMAYHYRRQEELKMNLRMMFGCLSDWNLKSVSKNCQRKKKLENDETDNYLNSDWADSEQLRRQFQGMGNISWRPR